MKIPCSNCNQRLEIPDEFAGQTIECPACKASLAVPAMAAPPPASAQVQESAPQVAPSRKSKSTMSKLLVASVVGVAIVVLMLIVFGGPRTPSISIHEAAKDGNIEAVKQHLATGIDVNTRNDYFETPLHGATTHGHKEMVELLIAKGSNVNSKDHKDITPLYGPTQNGHKEIVELLITKGSDVNAKAGFGEYKGQTPLDWAEETYESVPLETKAAKKILPTSSANTEARLVKKCGPKNPFSVLLRLEALNGLNSTWLLELMWMRGMMTERLLCILRLITVTRKSPNS